MTNFYSGKDKFKELDKNTKSFSLKNSNAPFPSALILGFWNSTLTIKLHPALPEGQRSTDRVFDYNTFSMGVLNAEKSLLLLRAIEDNMSEIATGDFDPIGVTSGAAFVEVSPFPGMDGIMDDEGGIYLNLYNKIDESGNPGEVICYKFNSNVYFKNYRTKGKSMEKCKTKLPSEFMLFLTFLKEGIKGLANGISHGIRNANKYEYSRAVNERHRMMEKLGLSSSDFKSGSFNGGGASSFFQGNSGSASASNDGEFNFSAEYGSVGANKTIPLD